MAVKPREKDHLLNLYQNWKKCPDDYGEEMLLAVEGIVRKVLGERSNRPVYKRVEDDDDLLQDLKLLGYRGLSKIKNPTNKRLYNYLKVSIQRLLSKKSKKLAISIDKESVERLVFKEGIHVTDHEFFFIGDGVTRQIAGMLSNGDSKTKISKILKMSPKKVSEYVNNLKEMYYEFNSS